MADKDRKAREEALIAAAKRAAAERSREAPLTAPAVAPPPAPPVHGAAPIKQPPDPSERLAMLMEAGRKERALRLARTRRNAAIAVFLLVAPILLWLLASLLRR